MAAGDRGRSLKVASGPTALSADGQRGRQATLPAVAEVAAAGLVYVSDAEPGIRRQRRGRSFDYRHPDGRRVTDAATLDRIRRLAIPPAYTEVWICGDARGHIQATGRDARGRKQYRYHPDWHRLRDGSKFERMYEFGRRLPKLRRRLRRDLALPGLPRDKVLATVVSLLERTLIRIGNPEYARDNKSYGLTTLRDRHVSFPKGRAQFRFRGKSGASHELELDDAHLARVVRRCQELPGQQLFQYIDDDGQRQPVDSGMVNAYLREAMGDDFTAKDFRTWGATLRALALLVCTPLPSRASDRRSSQCIKQVVQQVASALGNTPSVCRKAYIHPAVFETWQSGALHKLPGTGRGAARAEAQVLAFLRLQGQTRRRPGSRASRSVTDLHTPSTRAARSGRLSRSRSGRALQDLLGKGMK